MKKQQKLTDEQIEQMALDAYPEKIEDNGWSNPRTGRWIE